jgi:hypothetical protein
MRSSPVDKADKADKSEWLAIHTEYATAYREAIDTADRLMRAGDTLAYSKLEDALSMLQTRRDYRLMVLRRTGR